MSSFRRHTAIAVGCVIVALVAVSSVWAGQQAYVFSSQDRPVIVGPELALGQEIRVRPSVRFSGDFAFRNRSAVSRILAHAEELELTEVQEDQIRTLQRDSRRQQIRRDADREIAEMDLEEMMDSDTGDLDVVEQKMREIANLEVDARIDGLRVERSIMAVLTPEQRDQLDELDPRRIIYERVLRERRR